MLCCNNRVLTEEAIESVLRQTIPVHLMVVNNGSTDGAAEMLSTLDDERVSVVHFYPPRSVAASWNWGLRRIFETSEHALVVNNDILLHPRTYEWLLADGGDFVTCVGVQGRHFNEYKDGLKMFRDETGRVVFPCDIGEGRRPHPDFSCYLIRKWVWERVGPFDEAFKGAYAEDWDYHVRLHKAGVEAYCLEFSYLHYGAATTSTATLGEQRAIQERAESNREYFKSKWGVAGGSAEYYALFGTEAP